MRMPVLDGWAFVRRYRALPPPHAPIVVMTAATDAGQWAAEVGADGVLAKPFEIERLLDVLEHFLGH